MYTFKQSTGEFFDYDGTLLGKGVAGQGAGLNNPAMQDVHNIGPLPRGTYSIGTPYTHPHLGPLTFNLTPDPSNEMFGRSSFRIHGFASVHPELSSEGCITQHHDVRAYVASHLSTQSQVEVVE